MKTLHSIGLMTLCLPLATAEAYFLKQPLTLGLVPAFVFFPLTFLFSRGNRPALILTEALGISWCLGSISIAIHLQSIPLGFLTLLLTGFWLFLSFVFHHALSRSFMNPLMEWYQGIPQPIHGLQCELINKEDATSLSVSRLDRDGAFIFSPLKKAIPWNKKKSSEMIFRFKNKEVHCKGKPERILNACIGAGYRFTDMTVDMKKKLGDFVEILRGEGHVP